MARPPTRPLATIPALRIAGGVCADERERVVEQRQRLLALGARFDQAVDEVLIVYVEVHSPENSSY